MRKTALGVLAILALSTGAFLLRSGSLAHRLPAASPPVTNAR